MFILLKRFVQSYMEVIYADDYIRVSQEMFVGVGDIWTRYKRIGSHCSRRKKPHYILKESIPGITCNLVDVNHRDILKEKPGKSLKRLGGSRVKGSVCPSKAFRSFITI